MSAEGITCAFCGAVLNGMADARRVSINVKRVKGKRVGYGAVACRDIDACNARVAAAAKTSAK